MNEPQIIKIKAAGVGYLINRIQTLFVGMLRVWTIPIVLMLSVASGFTTYYGMSHFIIPWIALVITVAIQSIVVICSLEIASIHWQANRMRYFSVLCSLLIALTASVSFSYFKFYEISEQGTIHIDRLNHLRQDIKAYVDKALVIKSRVLTQQRVELEKASKEVTQAYFGTHPEIVAGYRNQVGEGPFWKRYNDIYQTKKQTMEQLEQDFSALDRSVQLVQANLSQLDVADNVQDSYYALLTSFQTMQLQLNQLSSQFSQSLPDAPLLLTYKQFIADVKPSSAMWDNFSLFAFTCAAMVDFFTVLLSYRLEFTAPGPLTADEEDLVFECLRQFTEFRINDNDELEMIIEKTELEKAQRYSDWSRMFAVGLLLNRGFLRKIDQRTVEFAPNLYPLIAAKMGDKINVLRAQAKAAKQDNNHE
ncbi:hypothetical protein [methanotrophic endosymbiont of Bathymodiolus puteoserpentis (Logatchev)]|jgi:hypothetical protein|uniref:hypothetical protein n=1 Tax=methanotrophic endosymbiont of Bathymodiolus puteoserpentis (Logatchev) TaxID=343235 RepID=UPI0013CBDDB8|nr:hypothetical protein [methanotrophic endosymbiont of Bathymodiolus puteoserpentis (Logatchev)]SHE22471.1 hypothetical protein BPUTEOMOX_1990 [methanotrophic endosymbiont of Bathymodiolus puteoserpentis (Logatchev)]